MKRIFIAFVILWAGTYSFAQEITGYVGIEGRGFFNKPLHDNQKDHTLSSSISLEYFHDFEEDNESIVATFFARKDSAGDGRDHFDINELYWWKGFDDFELYIGMRKIFWGVTETSHLVDVINSSDSVENIDGEDKLGQPMISLLYEQDWGTVEVFALTGFREPTYLGYKDRLRSQLVVDKDFTTYESSREERHIDFAGRYSHVIGDVDLGLIYFNGTNREASFNKKTVGGQDILAPHYNQVEIFGTDIQLTNGDFLWKIEATHTKPKSDSSYFSQVGGFEYTFVGIADSNGDLGIFMEYQFDERSDAFGQNDLAVGTRFVLNDVQSTEFLAAITQDLDNKTKFISIEASRRLTDTWIIESELRVFSTVSSQDALYELRDDDYLQVLFKRYF